MTRWAQIALIASTVLVGASPIVRADKVAPSDEILPPPPTYKGSGANVTEKLGARVPLDAKLTTHDGAVVSLGEVLRGELPTIITFNYADCPMLCSLQLNGLMAALPGVTAAGPMPGEVERSRTDVPRADATAVGDNERPSVPRADAPRADAIRGDSPVSARADIAADKQVAFRIGQQFRVVTISLEPTETLERAKAMREKYIAKLPEAQREAARAGWTFLVGDAAQIKRVADAVGFEYVYIKDRAEWAHPAALIFLSTTGVVTRYVYGIEFEPQMLRESIFRAGLAEPSTAVGFMNRCYHFDPSASDHSRAGMMALRIGAAGFLLLLVGCFGFYFVRRHARRGRPLAGEALS